MTEPRPMNAKSIASATSTTLPNVWYHWRMLRNWEEQHQVADPLPPRGLLQTHHAQRLVAYILERRQREKVKGQLSNASQTLDGA